MRISRDKVNKVAHAVTEALAETPELDFVEDRNTIRLDVRKLMEELLNQEELFLKMAGDLPKEMIFQRELLISRL